MAGELASDENIADPQEQYRITVYNILFDKLIMELSERFDDADFLTNFEALMPAYFMKTDFKSEEGVHKVTALRDFYKEDLCDKDELKNEYTHIKRLLETWAWVEGEVEPRDMEDLLVFLQTNQLVSTFPNLSILLRIGLTLPVTSAQVERSFSYLRKLKDYCRTKMGEDRLSNLACIAMNRDITMTLDPDKYIDAFSGMRNRLINL